MRHRSLAITYLIEEAEQPWGGVQTIFREADALLDRGHRVCIVCKTGEPSWYRPRVEVRAAEFTPDTIPRSDLVVGTWCPTVPFAWRAQRGQPVHYCQGYEGDDPRHRAAREQIENIYRLPGIRHLAISPFLAQRLRDLFGIEPLVVPYGIRSDLFTATPAPRPQARRLRVGLVGPWSIAWKDIATGVRGLRLAQDRGIPIELVRVSAQPITDDERVAWGNLAVEEHVGVRLDDMPEIYRSLDLFLGTSSGGAEGFFLPAVEAMACGAPCILSDIACFRDYAQIQDYARFFTPGSSKSLASAIFELAHLPAIRSKLRETGLRTAARHSFAAHVEGIERAFHALVPARHGSRRCAY